MRLLFRVAQARTSSLFAKPPMFRHLLASILQKFAMLLPGGSSIRPWLHRMRGVKIGQNVFLAQFVYIDDIHASQVTIGDNCTIGLRTTIFAHFYWGPRRPKSNGKVVIEKDVFVGPHCVILPNVTIGEGAVIKAGTVVTTNVPPHTFWGSPAAGPLGEATVPLTRDHSYEEFIRGTRMRVRGFGRPKLTSSDSAN